MKLIPLFLLIFCSWNANAQFQFDSLQYPFKTSKIILKNNTKIAYMEAGEGKKTLLFVHGLGSYSKAWVRNIENLQQDYRCIALDLPGYGKSDKGDLPYSLSYDADVIAELIQKMKLKHVSYVGHSMGGQIGINLALRYPKLVENLILIAPAGLEKFTNDEGKLLMQFTRPEMISATTDEKIKSNLLLNFFQMPEEASFMISDRMAMKAAPDFLDYCKAVSKSVEAMLQEPVYDQLKEIKPPAFIIFGENDALIPNAYFHKTLNTKAVAENAKNTIPTCQLYLIPEAGHFVNFEKYEEVNRLIRQFLK